MATDDVGFGRPPKANQFKPGQSGNPSGRPKLRRSFASELLEELAEIIVVDRGGKKLEMSNGRAIAKALVAAAVAGHIRAATLLVASCAKAVPEAAEPPDQLTEPDSEIVENFIKRAMHRRAIETDGSAAAESNENKDKS